MLNKLLKHGGLAKIMEEVLRAIQNVTEFIKKYIDQIVIIVVAIIITYVTAGAASNWAMAMGSKMATVGVKVTATAIKAIAGGISGALSGFATGLLATGSISGAFKAGLIGGLSGAAFSGIGAMKGLSKPSAIGLHGIAGGVKAELTGGKFSRGFMVSAFTKAVSLSNKLPGETALQRTVSAGMLSGAAMHLAGGDFRLARILHA